MCCILKYALLERKWVKESNFDIKLFHNLHSGMYADLKEKA